MVKVLVLKTVSCGVAMKFDLLELKQAEAQRCYSYIEKILGSETTDSIIRRLSKRIGVRPIIINKWVNAYKTKGIDGLIPLDWHEPSPETWQLIQRRRAELGVDVEAAEFSLANISNIAGRNKWSQQKSKRWATRFREGGLLALDPAKNPYRKRLKKTRRNSLGASPESALIIAFERKKVIESLMGASKDISKEIEILAEKKGISKRTLWNYLHEFRHGGLEALLPQKRVDYGTYRNISEEMVEIVRSIRLANSGWKVRKVYEEACQIASAREEWAPSEKQVRAIINSISPEILTIADGRPAEFKNRYEFTAPIPRADNRVVWQIDHTKVPVMLTDLRGDSLRKVSGEIRCYHTSIIDARSRKSLANTLWYDVPDRHCVATTIRDAILAGGIPHEIQMDRGRDFMARHVTQFLEELGINVVHLPPHQPQQKGIVERFYWTIETRLWSNQAGYTGPNQLERRKNLKASVDIAELERILQDFIEKYNNAVHSQTRRTPSEMYDDIATEIADVRQLDFLLMEAARRKVTKDGISYLGITYRSVDLVHLIGKSVLVRGRPTYETPDFVEVFYNEQWICTAFDSDILKRSEVRQAKIDQKVRINSEIKEAKELYSDTQEAINQQKKIDKPAITLSQVEKKPSRKNNKTKGQSNFKKLLRTNYKHSDEK